MRTVYARTRLSTSTSCTSAPANGELVTLSYTVPVRLAVSPVSGRMRADRAVRRGAEAREVAGDASITAARIGSEARAEIRLAREMRLVRRFDRAVFMASVDERSNEMCGQNGVPATRPGRFCDAFPHPGGHASPAWLVWRRVYLT